MLPQANIAGGENLRFFGGNFHRIDDSTNREKVSGIGGFATQNGV